MCVEQKGKERNLKNCSVILGRGCNTYIKRILNAPSAQNEMTRRLIHSPLLIPKENRDVSVCELPPYVPIMPPSRHTSGESTPGDFLCSCGKCGASTSVVN